MQNVIGNILKSKSINDVIEKKNILKELIQEIVLSALSKSDFFKEAAFYGGTALRIFYDLDRFSEDLDFSLLVSNSDFDISNYFKVIEDELISYGFNFYAVEKKKTIKSNVKSAFLKGNTNEHLLYFFDNEHNIVNKDDCIKIKFEIDVTPPLGATYELKHKRSFIDYTCLLYDASSLFAGKIHACLCRNWRTRVKGRDFYDFVFFIKNGIPVNLINLRYKLLDVNYIEQNFDLNLESLKVLLSNRFNNINFYEAKLDVLPFVKDKNSLNVWSKEYFINLLEDLKCV